MRAVVVQNQMHVQSLGDCCCDAVQELAELHRAVPGVEIAYDASAFHLQRCEQRGGAVPHIVVVRRSACPGRIGSSGWERSSA